MRGVRKGWWDMHPLPVGRFSPLQFQSRGRNVLLLLLMMMMMKLMPALRSMGGGICI